MANLTTLSSKGIVKPILFVGEIIIYLFIYFNHKVIHGDNNIVIPLLKDQIENILSLSSFPENN